MRVCGTDEEFGGTDFAANVGVAKKAIDKWATPGFEEMLNVSGVSANYLTKIEHLSDNKAAFGRTRKAP